MEAMLAATPAGPDVGDVEERIATLIDAMQSMALRHESLLRTMIHQTVLERGFAALPRRGTRRIDWIESAAKPVRARVGPRAYERLVSALSLCGGIEALLVLRDVRGLSEGDAIGVSRWAALALLRQTLQEAEAKKRTRPSGKARPRATPTRNRR